MSEELEKSSVEFCEKYGVVNFVEAMTELLLDKEDPCLLSPYDLLAGLDLNDPRRKEFIDAYVKSMAIHSAEFIKEWLPDHWTTKEITKAFISGTKFIPVTYPMQISHSFTLYDVEQNMNKNKNKNKSTE